MFEDNNMRLSADYNLIWTNMKDRVIQAFVTLYGERYNAYIKDTINNIKFVHVNTEEQSVLEEKFLDLYEKIRATFLAYHVISDEASVKDVLDVSRNFVNNQMMAYYLDNDLSAFDQLTSKIIECAYYYAYVRNNQGISYGNENGKYTIYFEDYYIPLEEMFNKINELFYQVSNTDTLMEIFNNLFAREMTCSFLSLSNNLEGLIQIGSIKIYSNLYDALDNDKSSILDNMFKYYHDYLKELFINNKYSDFIFFFEIEQYNKLNDYLNECLNKIYCNPNADMNTLLTTEEISLGVNILNSIYSKLSYKSLKK